jgi:hypothetical protein
MSKSLESRTVDVAIDTNNQVTFTGADIDTKGHIHFDADRGKVTFRFSTPATGVSFPSNPIEWVNREGHAINQPAGTTVTRQSEATFKIQVVTSEPKSFHFHVLVQRSGQFYASADPTIVTMRPGGGSGR